MRTKATVVESTRWSHLGSGVDHVHVLAVGVGLQDGVQHLLVLHAPRTEPGQGLAAPTYRRLVTETGTQSW